MAVMRQSVTHAWDQAVSGSAGATVAPAAAIRRDTSGTTLTAGLELTVVSKRSDMEALEPEWNALFERAGQSIHVFQAFNWNWHWANAFLDSGRTLVIVTGRSGGRLVMVWPMVMEKVSGLRVLSWMGEPVSQYGDVLIDAGPQRPTMLRVGWSFIVGRLNPDLARLNKTRADSAIAPLLEELGALVTQRLEAPYLDLSSAETFAAYEERYAMKARKNRRRQYRRLEERGTVCVVSHAEGAVAAAVVASAIELKRTWLADRGRVSLALNDPRTKAFFQAAAADTVRPTGIRVSTMTCAGQTAAVEIAFGCRDRLAIHIMAYDLAYEKGAVGVLLMEQLIERSLEAGVATYDLMAPGDGYKKEWADGSVAVCDYALPVTMPGRLYARGWLGTLRPWLRTAVQQAANLIARVRK